MLKEIFCNNTSKIRLCTITNRELDFLLFRFEIKSLGLKKQCFVKKYRDELLILNHKQFFYPACIC